MNWEFLFDVSLLADASLKIFLAALLGGLVGLERETHGQAAGLRTYILVATACCLIMMVSLHMEELFSRSGLESAVRVDPGRIASYALAGMGFLGAGAIITGKGTVKGLTTAAGMWMITAVGLAVGAGYFIPAILVTFVSLFSLSVLRVTKFLLHRDIYMNLSLLCKDVEGQLKGIEGILEKHSSIGVQFVSFKRNIDQGLVSYNIKFVAKENIAWRELERELSELPAVREVCLEEGHVP